jgi:hypothetical protein
MAATKELKRCTKIWFKEINYLFWNKLKKINYGLFKRVQSRKEIIRMGRNIFEGVKLR